MQEEEDKPINNNNKHQRKSDNNNNGGHEAQRCPRCDSPNTKFCYYNNYSLTQPRYFCKSCRRYWTHGGTLRNVPVGGGSRKGKRPKTAAAATPPPPSSSLAFPPAVVGSQLAYLPSFSAVQPQTSFTQAHDHLLSGPSAMSLLQGFADASPASSSFGQFYTNPNNYYPSGTSSEAAAWNIGAASNAGASGSSLAPPNQWPDIPGPYGSPPP